jgi:hypothetical protein
MENAGGTTPGLLTRLTTATCPSPAGTSSADLWTMPRLMLARQLDAAQGVPGRGGYLRSPMTRAVPALLPSAGLLMNSSTLTAGMSGLAGSSPTGLLHVRLWLVSLKTS